jgi:hypothetical protein
MVAVAMCWSARDWNPRSLVSKPGLTVESVTSPRQCSPAARSSCNWPANPASEVADESSLRWEASGRW